MDCTIPMIISWLLGATQGIGLTGLFYAWFVLRDYRRTFKTVRMLYLPCEPAI